MHSQEPNRAISVRRLTDVTETHISAMAAVLVDCVEGGASVGFLEPLDALWPNGEPCDSTVYYRVLDE